MPIRATGDGKPAELAEPAGWVSTGDGKPAELAEPAGWVEVVRALADWWDAVELWLTQLPFGFQVVLAKPFKIDLFCQGWVLCTLSG